MSMLLEPLGLRVSNEVFKINCLSLSERYIVRIRGGREGCTGLARGGALLSEAVLCGFVYLLKPTEYVPK